MYKHQQAPTERRSRDGMQQTSLLTGIRSVEASLDLIRPVGRCGQRETARTLSASSYPSASLRRLSMEALRAVLEGAAPSLALYLFMYTNQVHLEFNYHAVHLSLRADHRTQSSLCGRHWVAITAMMDDSP